MATRSRWMKTSFCAAALFACAAWSWSGAARADAVTNLYTNVAEASSFAVVYNLPIQNGAFSPSQYTTNNAALFSGKNFDRVAYYLELEHPTYGSQFVYVSMDDFSGGDASKLGVPQTSVFQQIVNNMNVVSTPGLVVNGTGLATGNIEFWGTNYGGTATSLIPGGTNAFDYDDTRSTSGNYGSMQIHNHGAGALQTILAYNHWNSTSPVVGIGNDPNTTRTSYNPDWTFAETDGYTASTYTLKNLVILAGSPTTWNGGGGTAGPLDGSGTWDTQSTNLNWWKTAATAWTDGENPIFGAGTGTAGTVTITDTVKPASITFSPTGGGSYTLTGGTIDLDGASAAIIRTDVDATINSTIANGGILKLGGATLTLGGTNTYAGDTIVQAGTLKLGSNDALGTTAGKTVIQSGATLDIAGFRAGSATPGGEPIEVSGAGVGGNGALINSVSDQTQAFGNVTLLGDTTFGGSRRWDFRSGTLDVGGYKITKVGGNIVAIVAATVTNPGDVDVNGGVFRIETSTNFNAATPATVRVASGARFDYWGTNIVHNPNFVLNGGTLSANSGGSPHLSGTITLNSNSTIGVGNEYGSPTLTIDGAITGAGGFTLVGRSTSQGTTGTLALTNAANSIGGTATVTSGTLKLAASSGTAMNRLYVGNGNSGAVIQDGGTLIVGSGAGSTDVLSLGLNGGYGYYRMNGGSLTTGQLAAGSGQGTNNVGVFDMYAGSVNVNASNGWLLAGGWTTNAKGALNLYGGTMTGPSGNAVTLNVFGRNSYGMLNMLGSTAVLDATANSGGLNLLRESPNVSSIVNLNAGTIIASRVQQSGAGNAQFNFNGGTLQAGAANVTMQLNTGGSAIVYGGGANIDTPGTTTMTINQPLLAPTGYGVTGVALTDGGASYVGAPYVILSGGSGYGASAIAQVDQATRKVTGIVVTSPGTGYGSGDLLTATLYGGGAITPATLGTVALGANTGGGLTKTGTGTLNLAGANTYTGTTNVNAGTLVFTSTSNNTIGGITVKGGAAGAGLRIEGTTNTGTGNVNVATATADRSTVVIAADATFNKLLVGSSGKGAVIQNGGDVVVSPTVGGQDVVSLGIGSSGYGYYQMNGGTLTTGQLAAGGNAGGVTGVFDLNSGTVDVARDWLLAGAWGANSKGSFNIFGGTLSGPPNQPVTLNVFNGNTSYAMYNLLGSTAVLDATANSGGLNLNRGTGNASAIVNLNAGTMIADRVQQSAAGPAQFNFNGGTLQTGQATVTMSLNTGGTAVVYAGGAKFDTPGTHTLTVDAPLLAPTGDGVVSIPVAGGGAGYIGAPFVVVSGGGGTGASAIAQVDLDPLSSTYGQLTNILVTSAGVDYTSTPTVTLYGGGATTAATLGAVTLAANVGGGLEKYGDGTLILAAANTYSGNTTINKGTLTLASAGSIDASPVITVAVDGTFNVTAKSGGYHLLSGQTLKGDGTVLGAVVVDSGAEVAPGSSPGILTLENGITFEGGTFSVELNGTTAGSGYDQLLVGSTGSVNLGPGVATLDVTTGFSPAPDDFFWIINNTNPSDTATTGYFLGLQPEGSSLVVDGRTYYIYYEADLDSRSFTGGNDVLLTTVPEPSTLALLATGLLGLALIGWRRRRRAV